MHRNVFRSDFLQSNDAFLQQLFDVVRLMQLIRLPKLFRALLPQFNHKHLHVMPAWLNRSQQHLRFNLRRRKDLQPCHISLRF